MMVSGTTTSCSRRLGRGQRPQAGFTLIELMVVVSIAAVLAFLAVPSMSKLIATQRLKAGAEDLYLSLLRTRSEAIKLNRQATLSPKGTWAQGWTITAPDPETAATLLLLDHASSGNLTVSSAAAAVSYSATGRLTTAAPSFVFTAAGTDLQRCVSVEPSGRPYTKEGSSC